MPGENEGRWHKKLNCQMSKLTFGEQVRKKLDDGTKSCILKPGRLDANTLFPSLLHLHFLPSFLLFPLLFLLIKF